MSTEILNKDNIIKELYNAMTYHPKAVYDIFKDFFGDERVDIQGFPDEKEFKEIIGDTPAERIITSSFKTALRNIHFDEIFIIIHFPEVRITNENDRYVDVKNLWARVEISTSGTLEGSFKLNRSEYQDIHWSSDYMHSHVNGISFNFSPVCTGTGPINNTICSLNRDFDTDMWYLFCLELSKYVETESLVGVPYRRLETIGTNRMIELCNHFSTESIIALGNEGFAIINAFIKHLAETKILKFNYVQGRISLAMSYVDYIVSISNEFISWYNKAFNEGIYTITYDNLIVDEIIRKVKIEGSKIYSRANRRSVSESGGRLLFKFKGEDIRLRILDTTTEEDNMTTVININIANYIAYKILQCVNYRYGREGNTTRPNTEVRYI